MKNSEGDLNYNVSVFQTFLNILLILGKYCKIHALLKTRIVEMCILF